MVCLQLGSNKGDRKEVIDQALEAIEDKMEIILKGAIYLTEAWGKLDQQDFYNQLIIVKTNYNPYRLLNFLKEIEKSLGRKKVEKWGPRIIDIDIVFYGQKIIYSPSLKIPHEFMHKRRFILEPLDDLKIEWFHPIIGQDIEGLLKNCQDTSKVKRLKN